MKFNAYRLFADGDAIVGRVTEMSVDDLSTGDVVIRNAFSSVNYKDALAGLGRNKIIRDYPRIGGIDLFGWSPKVVTRGLKAAIVSSPMDLASASIMMAATPNTPASRAIGLCDCLTA